MESLREVRLLDYLIRPGQHRLWDRQPKRLRGLEVDDELELRRLLDGEIGRLGALQDLRHVGGSAPERVPEVRRIAHEATRLHVLPDGIYPRQAVLLREFGDPPPVVKEHHIGGDDEGAGPLGGERGEGTL